MTHDEIDGKTVRIVGTSLTGEVISSYSYRGAVDAVDVEIAEGTILFDLAVEDVVIV